MPIFQIIPMHNTFKYMRCDYIRYNSKSYYIRVNKKNKNRDKMEKLINYYNLYYYIDDTECFYIYEIDEISYNIILNNYKLTDEI
jgi:hypothetical protein